MPFEPSALLVFLLLFTVIAAFVAFIIRACTIATHGADKSAGQLTAAKAAYDSSLAELARDPENLDLGQRALTLGRVYSGLTRDAEGIALYDEADLKSDLDTACTGAIHRPARADGQVSSHVSLLR